VTRNKLIQRIHVLKRDLGLDDDTYRTVLDSVAGKASCRDLEDEDLNLVLLALEKMSRGTNGATSVTLRNQRQHRFLARLMQYLNWDWKATARFCLHQTGRRSTRSCNAGELSKVIIGMIRLIDQDIDQRRLILTDDQLSEYHRYTKIIPYYTRDSRPPARSDGPARTTQLDGPARTTQLDGPARTNVRSDGQHKEE